MVGTMKTIHFISGLPRTGSTLLCNLLAQNPRFHTTHTSGCLDTLLSIRNNWSNVVEHRANMDWDAQQRVLKATLNTYHSTDKPVIFDKSRGWLNHVEFAEALLGCKAKIICTRRPVVEILASFEKLYRNNISYHPMPGSQNDYLRFQTIEGRCEALMDPNNIVGGPLMWLREAQKRGFSDRILFVEFKHLTNNLTKDPYFSLKEIYKFINESSYEEHDFNDIKQVTKENDLVYGWKDLHKIKSKIEHHESDAREVLGNYLYERYKGVEI